MSFSSKGSHNYGITKCGSTGPPCVVHHFEVNDNGTKHGALCATPEYSTPSSLGKKTEETNETIKKILLVSPIGPLHNNSLWANIDNGDTTVFNSFKDNYSKASCLINFTKKYISKDWGDKYSSKDWKVKNKYPGFSGSQAEVNKAKAIYEGWQTRINNYFNSDSVKCYLDAYKVYYSPVSGTTQAIIWLDGTEPTCITETTSSYSVQATVTDGTTAKNSSNSTSTSPHTYNVANGFSSLTLTFGGTISRAAGASYTDAVNITYQVGNASSSTASVGASTVSTSTNKTVTISPGTTSTDTSGDTVYVAAGATTPNICRTVTINPSSYSSTSGGSGSADSTVCVKVSRAADEIKYAKFTGAVTGVEETGSKLISSGGNYYTYEASGSTTFKVTGKITRKSDTTDTYASNASSRYLVTGTAQSASAYGLTSSSSTVSLAKGKSSSKNNTFTGSWSNLAKGGSTTVCGYLYYDSSVTYTNGSATSRTAAAATRKCVTIYRYDNTVAKFSGSTSIGTLDSSLTGCSDSGNTKSCTGIASQGSYSVQFSNSVSRTADASSITDAAFKYAVNKNGTDDTAKTSTLKVSTSKTNEGLGTNTVNVSVAESDTANQTATYCQYVKYNKETAYYNGSLVTAAADLTMDGSSTQKCISITRPKNTYKTAKFSGTVASISSSDSGLIKSGDNYYTYAASGTANFVVKGSISRKTASDGDSYTSNASSRYRFTLSSQSTAPYGITSSSSTSGSLARGGSSGEKSATISGSWSNLAKGGNTTVCGYLYYDSEISYKNGSENSRSQAAATRKCITIYRYSDVVAKFTASTSLRPTAMDSSLTCGTESSNKIACTGIASKGTYTVAFSNSVSRTGDGSSITNADFKYAVNKNGTDETAQTSTLQINKSKTDGGLGNNTASVSVSESDSADQTVSYCQKVKYNTSSTYYNGELINSSGTEIAVSSLTMDGTSTEKCVEITRPKNFYNAAKFFSGLKITETSGYLVSCSPNELTDSSKQNKTIECTGPAVQSKFTLKFEYIVNRKNDTTDTYSGSTLANSKAGTVLSEGAFSNSKYTSTLSLSTGALAKGGSKTVKTEASKEYTIAPGNNKTICAYLTYNDSLTIKNNVSVSDSSTAKAYKCIKITNPNPQTPVSFSGSSATPSLTDISYFTKKTSGEYYIASPSVLSSDNKYRVSYSHTVKRSDISNYTSSNQYKYVTSPVNNSFKAQDGSGTDVTGANWTEAFSITNAGVGDSKTKSNTVSVLLPAGYKKTVCQSVNYQTPITIRYSDQAVVGTPPRANSTQSCITLANPIYEYEYREPEDKQIIISPSTDIEQVTNVVETTGSSRTAKNVSKITVYMKHTLARGSDGFSDLVSPDYTGKIGLSGATLSVSGSGTTGNLASGASWISSRLNNNSSVYSNLDVKAGSSQAKTVCSQVISSPGNYLIAYGYRYRRETYVDGTQATAWEQNTTSKVRVPRTTTRVIRPLNGTDAQKYANNPDVRTGSNKTGSQSCVTITRPYNFKVTNISPTGTNNPLNDQEEASSPEFIVTVNRNEENPNLSYITDLSSKSIKVVSFVIGADTSLASAGNLLGGGTRDNDNFCAAANYTVKAPLSSNCWVDPLSATDTDGITRVGTNYSGETSYTQTVKVSRNAPANLNIGDKFCIAVAVSPISDKDNGWRVSQAYCRTKGKKPSMQVWSGSVLATGGINTSYTKEVSSGKYFGSWGDFSLISGGEIKKMASGAAFSGGRAITPNEQNTCDYSPLTIANEKCSKDNGSKLGQAELVQDYSQYYGIIKSRFIPSSDTLSSNTAASYAWLYLNNRASELELFNTMNQAGYSIYYRKTLDNGYFRLPRSTRTPDSLELLNTSEVKIYYSPGNIEITRNIGILGNNCRYNTPCTKLDDIVQNIIIADGDIIIDKNVTKLDAWVIAGGTINTCSVDGVAQSPGSSSFNSDTCSQPLEINGPVYAKNLVLSRTYGADRTQPDGSGSLSDPAERIDYNPSFLLWSYYQSSRGKVPQTTYLKKLSPRY